MDGAKVYVGVVAAFNSEGAMIPVQLTWENGKKYKIDRILDIRPAPALIAGGQGERYTVEISGRRSFLFFERSAAVSEKNLGRWFVERKARP